jgi:hypothetical protein
MASVEKESNQLGSLPYPFDTPQNPCTEYITFDVVDMLHPYNAIFRRDLLNTFKTVLHSSYLCLKILATFDVIPILWQSARRQNHRSFKQHNTSARHLKVEAPTEYKKAIEADSKFKKVPLDSSPRQSCVYWHEGKPTRTNSAASFSRQKQGHLRMVHLRSCGSQQRHH